MIRKDFDEYVTALKRHDWSYGFTDDHSVWRRAQNEDDRLRKIARSDPLYQKAFNIWAGYENGGTADKTKAKEHANALLDQIRDSIPETA